MIICGDDGIYYYWGGIRDRGEGRKVCGEFLGVLDSSKNITNFLQKLPISYNIPTQHLNF